jgi:hypothetical protein
MEGDLLLPSGEIRYEETKKSENEELENED